MVRPGQQSCSLLCSSSPTTLCVLPMLAGASKPHHLVDSNGVVLGFSHFGMLAAARWIKGQTRTCLEEALAESPGGCARKAAAHLGAWVLEPGLLGSSGACISPCDSHQPLSTRCHHLVTPGVQATASSLLGALFWHLDAGLHGSKSWGNGMHVIGSLSCWYIVPFSCGPHFSSPTRHSLGAGAAALLTMMLRCVWLSAFGDWIAWLLPLRLWVRARSSAWLPFVSVPHTWQAAQIGGSLSGSLLRSMYALCREVGGPFAEARCVSVACPSCMTLELAQSCGEYVVSGCVECSLCIVQAGPHPCADAARFRASWLPFFGTAKPSVYLTNCAKLGLGFVRMLTQSAHLPLMCPDVCDARV